MKQNDDRQKLLGRQMKALQEEIAPGGIPKPSAINGTISIPPQMNTLLRGQELVQEMENYRTLNSSYFHVTGSSS